MTAQTYIRDQLAKCGGCRMKNMKKPKHITVTMTYAEGRYLLSAASQCLGHSDAEKATFSHKSHRDAAYRAHDKIQAALHPADDLRCEGCREPATKFDSEGVPLCKACWNACIDESV